MLKKYFAGILAIIMVWLMSVPASAASQADGMTWSITVDGTYENVTSIGFHVDYDASAMEFLEGTWLLEGIISDIDEAAGNGVIAFTTGQTIHGTIAKLKFDVKADAPGGQFPVTVKVTLNPGKYTETKVIGDLHLQCQTHNWGAWVSVDDDFHSRKCNSCTAGETEPHQWDNGVITLEPTATEPGIRTFTCTACGHMKTETIPATGNEEESTEVTVEKLLPNVQDPINPEIETTTEEEPSAFVAASTEDQSSETEPETEAMSDTETEEGTMSILVMAPPVAVSDTEPAMESGKEEVSEEGVTYAGIQKDVTYADIQKDVLEDGSGAVANGEKSVSPLSIILICAALAASAGVIFWAVRNRKK